MKPWLVRIVAAVCITGVAGSQEPSTPAPVSPERLQKLVAQLGDSDFKAREQATQELSRLGRMALRALREAAATTQDLEVRRRATALVQAIQARDGPPESLLTILSQVQQAKPAPTDRQVAAAIYLLSVSRAATDAEIDAAAKRLERAADKEAEAEALMRPLLTGQDFNGKLADVNVRLLAVKKKLTGTPLAEALHTLNSEEFQKELTYMSRQLNTVLAKRSDEQLIETVFLVCLARYPSAQNTTVAREHLKKMGNRQTAVENILWALTNTKEFLGLK